MAFGDPSSPFFSITGPDGVEIVCLLDLATTPGPQRFQTLTPDLDAPGSGTWDPKVGTLLLEGSDLPIQVGSGIPTARSVAVDPSTGTVSLCGDLADPNGSTILYPGYFDTVPAGSRIADLLAAPEMDDEVPENDDLDWREHWDAERQAVSSAYSAPF